MAGFTYSILFRLGGQNALTRATQITDRMDNSVNRANRDINRMGGTMDRTGRRGRAAFDGMRSSVMGWVTAIGIGAATLSSLNAAAQLEGFEQAIRFMDAKEGAANLEFIRHTSDRLGLSLETSFEGFRRLQGGLMGTNISAQQTRDIFRSVGQASAVMRLSGEQTNGVFLALSQMASKGTVQAEELRGQLGERLPGAFNIAARAMGVTTAQLNKMLERGEVISEQFLPRFAAELDRTFGGGVADAVGSATANFGRFQSAVFNLKTAFGTELMPTVISFLQGYLIPAVKWVGENLVLIKRLAVGFGVLWTAVKAYRITLIAHNAVVILSTTLMKGYSVSLLGNSLVLKAAWAATTLFDLVLGKLTLSMRALNLAFRANPIGFLISALMIVGGAVVYAWNKLEGFRAKVFGVWEVMKGFGNALYDLLIRPLLAVGKTIVGVLTKDIGLIKSGMDDMLVAMDRTGDLLSIGEKVGNAYGRGLQKGINNFHAGSGFLAGLGKRFGNRGGNALDGVFGGAPSGGTGSGTGGGGLNIKDGITAITGGGSKNINISVGSLVESLTISPATVKEGVTEMKAIVERELLQIMNSANLAQ